MLKSVVLTNIKLGILHDKGWTDSEGQSDSDEDYEDDLNDEILRILESSLSFNKQRQE